MVEGEIIPRLMLAHRPDDTEIEAIQALRPDLGPETTEVFARLAASRDPNALAVFVGELLSAGITREQVLLELLVPTARRLGEFWSEDTASFAEVTVGLGRLQHLVRALGGAPAQHDRSGEGSPSVIFAPAPQEQHTFGLFIVEDAFRSAGWRTWIETSQSRDDLIDTVRIHWFDAFGVSASHDMPAETIAEQIRDVRAASRNPDLFVLFGGRLSQECPGLARAVGADADAMDGEHAVMLASQALLPGDIALSPLR